ncbi:MAG: ATP-dependent helicase HrpB [Shimia sp.]
MPMSLPIEDILPDLRVTMARTGVAVLQAPPGAGKTTRVPLALMDDITGKVLMLEPRRLAARAAAGRLAEQLGEAVGTSVGYRIRGDSTPGTKIEVVTEGILTRMLHSDPELPGIGCVIFDEFHERALTADLGLALTWEVRQALRPDLQVLVMSATLDAGPVAAMLDAPILTSEGRAFPVETRFLDRPAQGRLPDDTAALIAHAAAETEGGILVFLPGEREIRVCQSALRLQGVEVMPLYGAMPFKDQQRAIRPLDGARKIVLSTAIAETSLTIQDIRVVVDAGRARRARFDPGSGMSRLVTERVTRAEATQRAGRAGRVAPGVCYKLWTKGEDGSLAAFPPAEIEAADLTGLALDLALWGSPPEDLAFLTPPPEGALRQAQDLLTEMGALRDGRITEAGRAMARLPVHPRLAHMLLRAGSEAAPLAALLSDRDPLQTRDTALRPRLEALRDPDRFHREQAIQANDGALTRIRQEAKRLARLVPAANYPGDAEAAALAYPDRIGLRRSGKAPRYLLSGGKGAVFDAADPLAGDRLIVALDLDGDAREARIRLAAPLSEASLRTLYPDRITEHRLTKWSRRDRRVSARIQDRFGAIALTDRNWPDAPAEALAHAMCEGIRHVGLSLSPPAKRLQARVARARAGDVVLPDLSDDALLIDLETWLAPFLDGITTADQWKAFDALPALEAHLGWEGKTALDAALPAYFETPLGRRIPIDYSGDHPGISLRLQEMFGVTQHPEVLGEPLLVTLLSPAGRPIQVTRDIPGFWAGSYADVRKDMRAQYPKHPWPEDPTQADPTLRVKRRQPGA